VAGVLVPIFLIAIIAGVWYYRRYHIRRNDDDRVAFTNAAYGVSNMDEISMNDSHDSKGFHPEKHDKHDEHHHDKH